MGRTLNGSSDGDEPDTSVIQISGTKSTAFWNVLKHSAASTNPEGGFCRICPSKGIKPVSRTSRPPLSKAPQTRRAAFPTGGGPFSESAARPRRRRRSAASSCCGIRRPPRTRESGCPRRCAPRRRDAALGSRARCRGRGSQSARAASSCVTRMETASGRPRRWLCLMLLLTSSLMTSATETAFAYGTRTGSASSVVCAQF